LINLLNTKSKFTHNS